MIETNIRSLEKRDRLATYSEFDHYSFLVLESGSLYNRAALEKAWKMFPKEVLCEIFRCPAQ